MFAPNPPPRRMGWGGGYMFWFFFRKIFFLSILSAVREISRTFEMLTPPGRWTPRGGVGKNCFIDFLDIHGSHWHWLIEGSENDVITSRDSLWRHLPHNGSQKKLAAKSRFGDWPQWPHASRPFMGPIFGRNHSQVYPHMRAKFGHDRSSSLATYTWQTDRHTHRQNLYYIDIDVKLWWRKNLIAMYIWYGNSSNNILKYLHNIETYCTKMRLLIVFTLERWRCVLGVARSSPSQGWCIVF